MEVPSYPGKMQIGPGIVNMRVDWDYMSVPQDTAPALGLRREEDNQIGSENRETQPVVTIRLELQTHNAGSERYRSLINKNSPISFALGS